ncbi:hypothetical protein KUV80_15325 [Fictibacillus nanhaiensis]|uniref:hypothetical protein n=1 Tax=Fictibacillus nanhaiensis TaxID=742169 RepID=UPI001C96EF85|nr:hypothetical protein [Fictibacillus nanhaiensis]MBY6038045.1 hypothetical protein [Fictibacillus nanhaiensis]
MFFLLLSLLTAGLFIEVIQKHVLKKKDPDINELWMELEEQEWYKKLLCDPLLKEWILLDKQKGLLQDPYYVRKIIDKAGHREGFINYMKDKAK